MFPNLKMQIFRSGSHQNKLAKAIGIDETVLSKIIHGYRNPTTEQRKLLADYLVADEAWLFECFDAVPERPISGDRQGVAESKADGNGDL